MCVTSATAQTRNSASRGTSLYPFVEENTQMLTPVRVENRGSLNEVEGVYQRQSPGWNLVT